MDTGFRVRFASDGRSQRRDGWEESRGETQVIVLEPDFICDDGPVSAHGILKNN